MAMTEDLSVFFNTLEHAVSATLNGVGVVGILDPGYDHPSLSGFGPAGSSPQFTLPASSVPANVEGKLLVITSGPAAGNFKVGNVLADATGIATLHLLPN